MGCLHFSPQPRKAKVPLAAISEEHANEYIRAAVYILQTILYEKPLSSFERGRFEVLSDKLHMAEKLQLRGLLYLVDNNEEAFHKAFSSAITISNSPSIARRNYVAALVVIGDYETAEKQLWEIYKQPLDILRQKCLELCIDHAYTIESDDLVSAFTDLATKSNYKLQYDTHTLGNLLSKLEDDDPLLLSSLDALHTTDMHNMSLEECIADSKSFLKKCKEAAKDLETSNA